MKKLFIFVLFLITSNLFAFDQSFSDVNPSRVDYPYIEDLLSRGIIDKGLMFRPDDKINRAEFAKVVILSSNGVVDDKISDNYFPDVTEESWYWPYVQSAKYFGLIDGYKDGKYRPSSSITRAEALKIVFNVTSLPLNKTVVDFTDNVRRQWFKDYAYSVYYYGIYKGIQKGNSLYFDGGHELTRGEMAIYLSKALALSKY